MERKLKRVKEKLRKRSRPIPANGKVRTVGLSLSVENHKAWVQSKGHDGAPIATPVSNTLLRELSDRQAERPHRVIVQTADDRCLLYCSYRHYDHRHYSLSERVHARVVPSGPLSVFFPESYPSTDTPEPLHAYEAEGA